jgi:anti-sigma regulatory factor (Ser/Thr protein kinase)
MCARTVLILSVIEREMEQQPTVWRCFDVRFPPRPESVRAARGALETLHLPVALRETARLLLSELVANSVRHAGLGPNENIRVRAEWSGLQLWVTVSDRPRERASKVAGSIRPAPTSESGWGLYLIDRLATRWGVDGQGGHWFQLARPDRP